MAKIFITKLGYLHNPEFQIAKKPGEWLDSKPVYSSALAAVTSGLKELTPNTEIHLVEITDFDCYGKPVIKLSSIPVETFKTTI